VPGRDPPRIRACRLTCTDEVFGKSSVIIPGLAEITGADPPPGSSLRQADRAYKAAIADLTRQASLGIQPRSVTRASHTRRQS
jgi:hypothetical protein